MALFHSELPAAMLRLQVRHLLQSVKAMRAFYAALHMDMLVSFFLKLVGTSYSIHAPCASTFNLVASTFRIAASAPRAVRTKFEPEDKFA